MKTITKPNTNLRDIDLTIGICGRRLSGKDFIADQLVEKTSFSKRSLAHPIKEEYATLMDISIDSLYQQGDYKELHRVGLITLGAIRRDQHIDWWCEALHEKSQNGVVIIPDVRFCNEVEYFSHNSTKFLLFEITADDSSLKKRGWKETFADSTTTETERMNFQDAITETITNNDGDDTSYIVDNLINKYNLYNIKNYSKL